VADAILAVTPKQESPQTVSLTLREEISNTLIGYVEITLVPTGARIEASTSTASTRHACRVR